MTKITGVMFTPELATANVTGRKSQTRRTTNLKKVNECPDEYDFEYFADGRAIFSKYGKWVAVNPPYGVIGDVIWCREAFCYVMLKDAPDLLEGMKSQWVYKASVHPDWMEYAKEKYGYKWRPAIHMPREACRWWGRIINVRVERLCDISEADAVAEGVEWGGIDYIRGKVVNTYKDYTGESICADSKSSFLSLCQSITKKGDPDPVQLNPWCWVYDYEAVGMPDNFLTGKN